MLSKADFPAVGDSQTESHFGPNWIGSLFVKYEMELKKHRIIPSILMCFLITDWRYSNLHEQGGNKMQKYSAVS